MAAEHDDWHALGVSETLARLGASDQGLSDAEAAQRLSKLGPNSLPVAKPRGPLRRLGAQFHNVLIYVLLASAAISAAMGHALDASVILAVVILNALIGFIQEGRAEEALSALSKMLAPRATLRRGGQLREIAAETLVPGDVVVLEAGSRVPADLRLLRARGLAIDEAMLTGESVPADKAFEALAQSTPLAERRNMAFAGSFVVAGQGLGVAVATGAATELGRISAMVGAVAPLETPLLRQMTRFGRALTLIILGASALSFAIALWRGFSLVDALIAVIGIAVAAIPEGLPAIMTIALAIGVQRMAARHAIVREVPAVETLGAVSVICSDKTGTLTRNEMTVAALITPGGQWARGGPVALRANAEFAALCRAAVLCNDADANVGDPMERALLAVAVEAGFAVAATRARNPRQDEIPFDARHRFMASLNRSQDGGAQVIVKGAPERVFSMCPNLAHHWLEQVQRLAATGQRVLAFAHKPARPGQHVLESADMSGGFELLGLVGFIDPPREEAIAAVAECRAAGVRVVMITGDSAETGREIARQVGISEAPSLMTGAALEGLDDQALRHAARNTDVFARTTPEHKLRLVEALQADGSIVAMTGDGVNDAPALKRADVGVAMGQRGTDAASAASKIVLADDNFATIVAAVREGRTVYDNLMKVIAWTLPTNGGEGLIIIAAILLGVAMPITPIQILWVNMVTAVALGLALAFEPTEPGVMARPPRAPARPLIDGEMLWRIGFMSALFVALSFALFVWATGRGEDVETARTLVVDALVMMEIFYLFAVRRGRGAGALRHALVATPTVWIGVTVTLLAQAFSRGGAPLQQVFWTRALGRGHCAGVVGAGGVMLLLVEAERALRGVLARRR